MSNAIAQCGLDPSCLAWEGITNAPGMVAGAAADSAVQRLADAVSEAAARALASLASAWVEAPTPSIADLVRPRGNPGGGIAVASPSPAVEFAQQLMWPITLGIMVIALMVAGIRMIIAGQRAGEEGRKILTGLITMLTVSSLGLVGFTLLIEAADATSSWILENAIDNTAEGMANTFTTVFQSLLAGGGAATATAAIPAVLVIVGGIVLLLICFVQIILMMLRGGILVVMAGLLPTVAAGATTQTGMEWLQRYIRWAFALILFKPIAALIYAICFKLLVTGDEEGDELIGVIVGLGLLFMACMALPALMRIIAPAAAAVAGNAGGIVAGAAAGVAAVGAMAVPMLAGGAMAATSTGASTPSPPPTPPGDPDPPDQPPPGNGQPAPALGAPPDRPATGTGTGTGTTGAPGPGGSPGPSGTDGATGSAGALGTRGTPTAHVADMASRATTAINDTLGRTAEGATDEPRQD